MDVMDVEAFLRQKKQLEAIIRKRDERVGAHAQLKTQLQKKFDVSSEKQAKKLLQQLKDKIQEQEKEYQQKLETFKEQFGDKL